MSVTLCVCLLIGIIPVSAVPPNTVLPLGVGQTVFLGEKNVATFGPMDVAFFKTDPDVPFAVVTLNNPDNFDGTSHIEFNADNVGVWYDWTGGVKGAEVFRLVQPNMSVLVRDFVRCNNQDRTGTSVMNSQPLQFRTTIDPNVAARIPAAPMVYDINLADNARDYPELNTPVAPALRLIGRGSIQNPVGGIPPNPDLTVEWIPNALDGKGQYVTPTGDYTFNATCKINGLTVTSPLNSLTLVKPSVDIAVTPTSVQRGTRATVTITGEPETQYYFAIIECPLRMTGANCDRPPWIVQGSEINGTLEFDPLLNPPNPVNPLIADQNLVPNCCGGLPINTVVPPVNPPDGPYFAMVTTDCNGVASFLVDSDSNTWKASGTPEYTLHVQKVQPEIDGSTLFKQTTLTLTRGTVTLGFYDAADPTQASITEAYLGDLIGIKGTNTETAFTFLYMTGPCQPECGGRLLPNPYPFGLLGPGPDRMDVIGGSWTFVTPGFIPAHTWWDTSVLPINPGTYTIYALADWPTGCPTCVTCGGGACTLLNCPNCLVYAVGTITLKDPTLSATVNDVERCCCPGFPCGTTIDGQPIRVVGNATGNTPYVDPITGALSKDVNVWLFGQGKVGDLKFLNWRQPIPCDGEFNFTIPLAQWNIPLCSLDAGTYDLIVQTHGYNQQYDVVYEVDTLGTALSGGVPIEQNKRWIVTTYPVNSLQDQFTNPPDNPDYAKLVQVEGPGYVMGTEALNGLIRGLEDPNIDDQYVHVQFTIKSRSCLAGTDFDADRTYGNSPLTVRFTDKSADSPTSWLWDFGDGTTSTEQNPPAHEYTKVGRYTVSLTTNGDSTNKQVKNDLIRVAEGPIASFSMMPADNIAAGMQVQFVDLSTGNPSSWEWSFGDGVTTSMQSPAHTYQYGGNYSVSLTAGNANGMGSTATKNFTVSGPLPNPLVADFGVQGLASNLIQFKDLSTGKPAPITWFWDFGDGYNSTEQNPTHTYIGMDEAIVTLTVSNGISTETVTKNIGVIADFDLKSTGPRTVQFRDLSSGVFMPTSWVWTFGDGETSTLQSPVHTYKTDGQTPVTLTVTNGVFKNTITKTIGIL